MKKNRLANETSPYLLQHADNPVDWYPWCDEAFERAIKENKPILLSIGYSTCHWCHVMAHESFEDEETAKIMNKYFINIKVDREERPDLDKIYQLAYQLLINRGGGWPLTLFITPHDRMPFFAGTYFPPTPKFQLPSFKEILEQIHTVYQQQQDVIQEQNKKLATVFMQFEQSKNPEQHQLDQTLFKRAFETLEKYFDYQHGGFGGAPKFPQASRYHGLLHYAYQKHDNSNQALEMLNMSLGAMAFGGIYDQLAGGFFRYSVDEFWNIPHFEKMLYDNAQLLTIYADGYAVKKEPLFKSVIEETANWLLTEMQAPNKAFYSAIDADSEGAEGKFYVWDQTEIKQNLTQEEFQAFSKLMGLDLTPNFESHWHLYIAKSQKQILAELKLSEPKFIELIESAKNKLLAIRNQRIRPHRDEKILTSWNALTLKAFAHAGRILDREDYINISEDILNFIKNNLFVEQTLYATYQNNERKIAGFLDDYVFLVDGILELLQARWNTQHFELALTLLKLIEEKFLDPNGGFFFTAQNQEQTLFRPKSWMDEALPNSNGIAAQLFYKFGFWLGNPHFLELANHTLNAAPQFYAYPDLHENLLIALEYKLAPAEIVVLTGAEKEITQWRKTLLQHYNPSRLNFYFPPEIKLPTTFHYDTKALEPKAYICQGTQCLDVITNQTELANYLTRTSYDNQSNG